MKGRGERRTARGGGGVDVAWESGEVDEDFNFIDEFNLLLKPVKLVQKSNSLG